MDEALMAKAKDILKPEWYKIFKNLCKQAYNYGNFVEALGFSYSFFPQRSCLMSENSSLFLASKASAMYDWYLSADPTDTFILKHFKEYEHCIDDTHKEFNSNYGVYAYRNGGLKKCIDELLNDSYSRHAMFCINNNDAMSDNSIDKLCTNTIQFLIRENKLRMVVQMRSSNFFTLLPYDVFMFSVFYADVYNELIGHIQFSGLFDGDITIQVSSIHFHVEDISTIRKLRELKTYDIMPQLARTQYKELLHSNLKIQTYYETERIL